MSNDTLRDLCIENNWFTWGDNVQYSRLFNMNTQGCSIEELALVIWLCSDETWNRTKIENKLREKLRKD